MIITAQIKQVVASEKKNNAKGYGAAKSRKKKKHWDMFVSDFDN